MKKTILILGMLFFAMTGFSQDYLQKNDTIIKLSGFDLVNNNVRYDLITPSDTNGIIEYIPDLWSFVESKIVSSDVDKTIWRINNDAIIGLLHENYFTDYEIKNE